MLKMMFKFLVINQEDQLIGQNYMSFENKLDFYSILFDKDKLDTHETFYIIRLNHENKVLSSHLINQSYGDSVSVNIGEIDSILLRNKTAKILISHNHPSKIPLPSLEDFKLTSAIGEIASKYNVELMDHVIYCENNYYSFVEGKRLRDNKIQDISLEECKELFSNITFTF